ncbi:MAG: type II toxin-antitoxin system RelE/ParE family toxin [Taibaiella sp.]|nr:type II toxin-antitoxin system RelE/ParE family toxin [Taibaiella sp.]
MIVSIQHKGLKLLWTKNDSSKIRPDHLKKVRNILTILNGASQIEDVDYPGADLHSLKGELKGFWSISVNCNYRITFKFINGDAYLVDYIDYH